MGTVTPKLKCILFLTSAVVMLPETVLGEDNQKASFVKISASKSSSNSYSINKSESISAAIAEPESFQDLSELGSDSQDRKSLLVKQARVTDLTPENNKKQPCVPVNIGDVEFTRLVDLTSKNSNQKHCVPSNIGQPEFSHGSLQKQTEVSKLEKKQVSPNSDDSINFTLVETLDKKIVAEKPVKSKKQSSGDAKYINPPKIIPDKKIPTFLTNMSINGKGINHLTKGEFISNLNFGDGINTRFDVNGILKLNGQITSSLTRNNVLILNNTSSYLQLQTVPKKTEVTVSSKEPQTILGTDIQLSLIGSCVLPGSNPDDLCTFTPGLVTDTNSIDPDVLVPTNFLQPSQFGEVVTSETLTAIQQPGFQRGTDEQDIGVDLSFPNIGSTFGNTESDTTSITRKETITNTPVGFYSRVRQVLKANDTKAVIGRTVRGFGFIVNDKNTVLNSALQLANVLLPDAEPQIKGGTNAANQKFKQFDECEKSASTKLTLLSKSSYATTHYLRIYNQSAGQAYDYIFVLAQGS